MDSEALAIIQDLGNDPDTVALTFDDGPNEPYTLRLLDILSGRGVKATFFLIGRYVRHRPDIARAIYSAGHAIGNHSYTHRDLSLLSDAEVTSEVEDCQKAIEDAGIPPTLLFRPPYGRISETAFRKLGSAGLKLRGWSILAADWEMPSTEVIVRRISEQLDLNEKSEIILLHDGAPEGFGADRSQTVEATRLILEGYQQKRFVLLK
jgi:peptidoglycan-N-acetylglucosamine deacetylase